MSSFSVSVAKYIGAIFENSEQNLIYHKHFLHYKFASPILMYELNTRGIERTEQNNLFKLIKKCFASKVSAENVISQMY